MIKHSLRRCNKCSYLQYLFKACCFVSSSIRFTAWLYVSFLFKYQNFPVPSLIWTYAFYDAFLLE